MQRCDCTHVHDFSRRYGLQPTVLTPDFVGVQVLCPEFASNTLFLGGDVGEDAFLSLHNNPSLANSQQACSVFLVTLCTCIGVCNGPFALWARSDLVRAHG